MGMVDALVCIEPGQLRLEQRPAPATAPGHALVRPRRVGICGTDYHIFQGKHPFLQYPRVMGHELAVEVVEAPAGDGPAPGAICVVNPYLACGDCVACRKGRPNCCASVSVLGVHQDGGMTGLLSIPAAHLVPAEGLSLDDCAAVEFLAIGAHAVRRGAVAGGDRVLVVGAGPIGIGAALFARLAGGEVTIFDRDAERAELAGALAGVAVIAAEDASIVPRESFDVVLEATGNPQAMERGFDFVAYCGRYVLIGIVKDRIGFSDQDFHRREMTLIASRNATSADFDHVIAAIRDGHVPVDRLLTHRTDLAGAVDDLPRWTQEKTGLVKAVIEID